MFNERLEHAIAKASAMLRSMTEQELEQLAFDHLVTEILEREETQWNR